MIIWGNVDCTNDVIICQRIELVRCYISKENVQCLNNYKIDVHTVVESKHQHRKGLFSIKKIMQKAHGSCLGEKYIHCLQLVALLLPEGYIIEEHSVCMRSIYQCVEELKSSD